MLDTGQLVLRPLAQDLFKICFEDGCILAWYNNCCLTAIWGSVLKWVFFFPLTVVNRFAFIIQITHIYNISILSEDHIEHFKKAKKASLSWSIKDYLNHILFSVTHILDIFLLQINSPISQTLNDAAKNVYSWLKVGL